MKRLFILFTCLFLSIHIYCQENNCLSITKSKQQEQLEIAINKINHGINSKFVESQKLYFSEATDILRSLNDKEEYPIVNYYLALTYIYKPDNNFTLAEQYLKKVIDACPDDIPEAYFHLGKLAYTTNQKCDAINYFKKFLTYQGDFDTLFAEAKMLMKWSEEICKLINNPVPFNPKLVKGISSQLDDYLVSLSPDNEIAYYTRKTKDYQISGYKSEPAFQEKFYFSYRISDNVFDNGKEMPYPFNRNENEGGATITGNNKELIYTVCKMVTSPRQYYNCDLYSSKNIKGYWTDIVPLERVNRPDTWESMPSVTADGKELYFVSNRSGGVGGYDIYKSIKDENGEWSEPINIGKPINTSGDEKSPFIHTDTRTLYFSSNGRPGIGGYDIYYVKINDNNEKTEVKNIGYPINTENDEVGFIVSIDGKYGYFSSNNIKNESLGGMDFYYFSLYNEAKPEEVILVKGNLKSEDTTKPIKATVQIKSLESKRVTFIPVDEDGDYVASLLKNEDYLLTIKGEDIVYQSTYVAAKDSITAPVIKLEMEVQPIEVGMHYRLHNIYFAFNSADILSSSQKVLDEFIVFLNDHPTMTISIEGHTDNVGSDEFNLILSENRAKAVYNYLVNNGIDANRLQYKGFGKTNPIATNETEEGRAMNRRTEFVILND
ncbi:MAG TPA: OmpA family protein [Bacteroidales bacterium]|nr:OmpA family protein [Bacteroidales bacterium]HOS20170.1 OmpA family protein [Bacteroidales bacterium]HPL02589.1 OmpA family protein [Bacteroidales bacterium]HQE78072.1 OmpA family protein [Bacteroidales bacterium]HQH58761.1 OmpA family protein [Bacteroidales bacterium]